MMRKVLGWVRRHPLWSGWLVAPLLFLFEPMWSLYPKCYPPRDSGRSGKLTIKLPQSDDFRAMVKHMLDWQNRYYWDTGKVVKVSTFVRLQSTFDFHYLSPNLLVQRAIFDLLEETYVIGSWENPPDERLYIRPPWVTELKANIRKGTNDLRFCRFVIPLVTGVPPTAK